jgi:hypothetical protein
MDGWDRLSDYRWLLTLLIHILRVANRIQHLTSIDDSSSRPASLFNNKEQCESVDMLMNDGHSFAECNGCTTLAVSGGM